MEQLKWFNTLLRYNCTFIETIKLLLKGKWVSEILSSIFATFGVFQYIKKVSKLWFWTGNQNDVLQFFKFTVFSTKIKKKIFWQIFKIYHRSFTREFGSPILGIFIARNFMDCSFQFYRGLSTNWDGRGFVCLINSLFTPKMPWQKTRSEWFNFQGPGNKKFRPF